MKISLFVGDIADAPAEAICTSTNPRLSLMMGTGGSVRERGGWDVLRECEAIVRAQAERTGRRHLGAASVHVTTAGKLPYTAIIHCVACDASHLSSPDVVRACVRNALAAARERSFKSVAMPVFGTGHAHVKFERALTAMLEVLQADTTTTVEEAVIVVIDEEAAREARPLLRKAGIAA